MVKYGPSKNQAQALERLRQLRLKRTTKQANSLAG